MQRPDYGDNRAFRDRQLAHQVVRVEIDPEFLEPVPRELLDSGTYGFWSVAASAAPLRDAFA